MFSDVRNDRVDFVGAWLGLPQSKRDEIMRNYHDKTQKMDALIDAFISEHPCPTWTKVAGALHGVGLHRQADEVKRTYVQGTISLYTRCLSSN